MSSPERPIASFKLYALRKGGYGAWIRFYLTTVPDDFVAWCTQLDAVTDAEAPEPEVAVSHGYVVTLQTAQDVPTARAQAIAVTALVSAHLGCDFEVDDQGIHVPSKDGFRVELDDDQAQGSPVTEARPAHRVEIRPRRHPQ